MRQSVATTGRKAVFLALGVAVSALLVGVGQPASGANQVVTAVQGSAFGCYSSVSLFGGPAGVIGPLPTATLPPSGGADSATAPECRLVYGPATLFTSGPVLVDTNGTTGPTGSVTSTATLGPVNTSGQETFTAGNVSSTCTASDSGVSGSTTIVGGVVQTSQGDPNVDGDETYVPVPLNPAPNTVIQGQIESVGDSFRWVFNEQIVNPDGSLTVNAGHLYLLGPTAVGDLIIGQVVCGVTTQPAPTTTTVEATTTTTSTPANLPTNKDQCKKGGYAAFGFKNQGQCVSFVNHHNKG